MNDTRYGWLVSYPRSGNTWLRLLLDSLSRGGTIVDFSNFNLQGHTASRGEFDELMGIESDLLLDEEIAAARPALHRKIAQEFDGPLLLRKVHDRCWTTTRGERVFPPEMSRGAVYIVRDPRDVAVSCANFFGLELDETIRRMNDPDCALAITHFSGRPQLRQPIGTWSGHVTSWLDESAMRVHLVRYEDMLADTAGELSKVANFLGLPDHAAASAARAVTFRAVQLQEERHGFPEQPRPATKFFRVGRAGEWRNVLSDGQAKQIVRDHECVMSRLGYW